MTEFEQKQILASYARRMWDRGWVANHDGNLSLRLKNGRFLCTPTGVSKADVTSESVLIIDEQAKVVTGKGRPFSEINLHLAFYCARPDVQVVMHAHPPTATGFGVAGVRLEEPFLPEAMVSLGPRIPTVPLSLPGADAGVALAPYLDDYDALLLAGNGVLTAGSDAEQAYLRLELVEHLAKIALVAQQLGGWQTLPARFVEPLLAARKKAGLGPEARTDNKNTAKRTAAPSDFDSEKNAELSTLIKKDISRVLS